MSYTLKDIQCDEKTAKEIERIVQAISRKEAEEEYVRRLRPPF